MQADRLGKQSLHPLRDPTCNRESSCSSEEKNGTGNTLHRKNARPEKNSALSEKVQKHSNWVKRASRNSRRLGISEALCLFPKRPEFLISCIRKRQSTRAIHKLATLSTFDLDDTPLPATARSARIGSQNYDSKGQSSGRRHSRLRTSIDNISDSALKPYFCATHLAIRQYWQ